MFDKIKSFFKSFFFRWKTEEILIKTCNRATPLHRKVSNFISCIFLVIAIIVWLCAFPSSAEEGITPLADVPTDLTGYTVTVPANWSAEAGEGVFYINTDIPESIGVNSRFYIGYVVDIMAPEAVVATSNSCVLYSSLYEYTSSSSFSFLVTGGDDSSNPDLIQWLADNNATFEGGSSSEPVTYSISSGYYNLAPLPSHGVPSVVDFSPGIEHLFETPVELFYNSGVVKRYNYFGFVVSQFIDSNNFSVDFTVQLLDIDNSVRIANLTAVDGVCTSQFYGGISNIYFTEAFSVDELSQQLILFTFALDSSFIPDEPDIPDLPDYNPWAYILEMIIEALKVPLFGYFSVWDIFVTICSIFILTWLLKLLAGG